MPCKPCPVRLPRAFGKTATVDSRKSTGERKRLHKTDSAKQIAQNRHPYFACFGRSAFHFWGFGSRWNRGCRCSQLAWLGACGGWEVVSPLGIFGRDSSGFIANEALRAKGDMTDKVVMVDVDDMVDICDLMDKGWVVRSCQIRTAGTCTSLTRPRRAASGS